MSFLRMALVAAFLVVPTALLSADATVGDLSIAAPFARATPPGARVAGGYMAITNNGETPDRLVSAEVDFAGLTEIHEMKVVNDVMRMKALDGGLTIGPGETVRLAPGGFHLMFMRLKAPLAEGETRKVRLTFERAGSVEIEMAVGGLAAREAPAAGHGDRNSHGDHSGHGD